MSNEHPYRACPCCGGVDYLNLPDLAVELHQAMASGMGAMKVPGMGMVVSAIVCQGCGKTDFFMKNAPKISEKLKNVSQFRAVQR